LMKSVFLVFYWENVDPSFSFLFCHYLVLASVIVALWKEFGRIISLSILCNSFRSICIVL
jgi:hypothetical protein